MHENSSCVEQKQQNLRARQELLLGLGHTATALTALTASQPASSGSDQEFEIVIREANLNKNSEKNVILQPFAKLGKNPKLSDPTLHTGPE